MLVHQGDRLIIPDGSALRARIGVAPVEIRSTSGSFEVNATIEADPGGVTSVVPPVTGRLTALRVGLGDFVEAGQLLAQLSAPDYGQAESDAIRAADALDLAQRARDRARSVHDAGGNAVKDVEAAEATLRDAQAEDERARDRLRVLSSATDAGGSRGSLDIPAPARGYVTALNAAPGAYLNDTTAPLLVITSTDRVYATAMIPESLLAKVSRGMPAKVTVLAYPGAVFQGKVASVSPVLELDSRRVKARIALDNRDGRLKANLFATVTLREPAGRSVRVPASSLLMNNDSLSVLVEVAPWSFVRRPVRIGAEDDRSVEVTSGLNPGDRVVIRGGVLLND